MNCQELTDSISNIKAQISELDKLVDARDPKEAIDIKNDIIKQFNGELAEYTAPFYRDPTPENYDKEVNRIINKIGDKDPSEVSFSRKELIFIYDTDDKAKFSNFNRESVIKINEIREKRISKQKEDASIIFNLSPDQIACANDVITPNTPKEDIDSILKESITPDTRLYIGPLFPGIFDLPNLEHIYTSFPEGKIRKSSLEIGGKTKQELKEELEKNGHEILDYPISMMRNPDFIVSPNTEILSLIRLKVSDLGFPNGATTQEICDQAEKFGLRLCPPETGPYQRLQDKDQEMNSIYRIAVKQITASGGSPLMLPLMRTSGGSFLGRNWPRGSNRLAADNELIFCLRSKPEQSSV